MAGKPRRVLGDLDASSDDHLGECFVETELLDRVLTGDSDIIYGSKGVGKTALRRALSELNRNSFLATKSIDLDTISFAQLHAALSTLRDTVKAEVPTLASNIWRNVLAMYCLESVSATPEVASRGDLKRRIDDALLAEGFVDSNSNSRVLGTIERLLNRIVDLGLKHSDPTPLGLNRYQREVAARFPATQEIADLLRECSARVVESGNPVLLCIDGFDSIVDHTPESRKAIFAGLIDAIQKSSRDPLLGKAFAFKAFLPRELTDDVHSLVWDADKHLLNRHTLTWTDRALEEFALRRMSRVTRVKSQRFLDVWHEVMPEKVRNDTHKVDEASFSYVLRHTLYRPRQLLTHLQRLVDKWDQRNGPSRIDPAFMPHVVAETNKELAGAVVAQVEIRYPVFRNFMRSFRNLPSTMRLEEFRDRMARFMQLDVQSDLTEVGLDLFGFGIFGIAREDGSLRSGKPVGFRFAFVGDQHQDLYLQADAADTVALSPMFIEFCGCTPSECGVIVPM